ncbi:MAG: hypothetical protein LVR00_02625 [Rhabdochlamydiaceae bacterium]|jgi:hypothetical protein
MQYSHRTWIIISGLIWCAVGVLLLIKGLTYIVMAAAAPEGSHPLFSSIAAFTGTVEQAALFLISLGLLVGFIKGRYVLSKTVSRITKRILSLNDPIDWKDVYPKSYYILIFSMMLIGVLFKWLPIGFAIKGFVDVAIGSALINGALLYFRKAMAYSRITK